MIDASDIAMFISHHGHFQQILLQEGKQDVILFYASLTSVTPQVEHIVIANFASFNDGTRLINFSSFTKLKTIDRGCNCFRAVRKLIIDGLPELEQIVIRDKCFYICDYSRQNDGLCQITNCKQLQTISFGAYSFFDYQNMTLASLDHLHSIIFDEYSFHYTLVCNIQGMKETCENYCYSYRFS